MVHRQREDPLVLRDPDDQRAEDRAGREVEAAAALDAHPPAGLGVGVDPPAQVDDAQVARAWRPDDLHRTPVDGRVRGAQHLVPPDDLVERAPERVDAQPAPEAAGDRDVVRPRDRLELVEQPDALLRERQRELAGADDGDDRARVAAHRSGTRNASRPRNAPASARQPTSSGGDTGPTRDANAAKATCASSRARGAPKQ